MQSRKKFKGGIVSHVVFLWLESNGMTGHYTGDGVSADVACVHVVVGG